MSYEPLLEVPTDPPNGGSLIVVAYNQDFIPALMLAVDTLKEKGYWIDPPDDIENIISTLKQALITSLD